MHVGNLEIRLVSIRRRTWRGLEARVKVELHQPPHPPRVIADRWLGARDRQIIVFDDAGI